MVDGGREEEFNLFYLIDRIHIAHPNRKLKFVYEVQRFHYGNFLFHENQLPPRLFNRTESLIFSKSHLFL